MRSPLHRRRTEDVGSDQTADGHDGLTEPTPARAGGRHGLATSRTDTSGRRRRRIGYVLLAVGGLVVLGGVWLGITAFLARSQLNAARTDVHTLRTQLSQSRFQDASTTLADLKTHAGHAEWLTSGPAWALAAELPAGGQAFESARGIADAIDTLSTRVLPPLVDARRNLDPVRLRQANGSIDLAPIAAAAPSLERAARNLTRVQHSVDGLPTRTWIGAVDRARNELVSQVDDIASPVRSVALAARVLPGMLGDGGTKTYFVGFQNEAEARGTGGLPGAFGILSVTAGKATFRHFENDAYLSTTPTCLNLGADYNGLWGAYEPTSVYVNSSVSANFPYAARIWTQMWQKRTGQRLDGAVAVDPTALGYLLQASGPAQLQDGSTITGDSVAQLTESTVYAKYTDNAKRKAYLLDVAEAAGKRIVAANGSASGLLSAGQRAVKEGRILVWSANPGVEADLAPTPLSGEVPTTVAPYLGVVVQNETGSKLDYYLVRSTTWTSTGCGSTRSVTATVSLTNNAPASGLPAYVTTRADDPDHPVQLGDERVYLVYYATNGADLTAATIDGTRAPSAEGAERGHPVFSVDVELPRGRTTTVVLHLDEPAGNGAKAVVKMQPSVQPQTVDVHEAQCTR